MALRPVLALLAVLAVGLAGCGGKATAPATSPPTQQAASPAGHPAPPQPAANHTIGPALGLQLATSPVPVSVPGHRTSEFTVARDPTQPLHLVAAGMDWDSADGTVQCAAFVSRDGGHAWTAVQALPGHVATDEDTDPWVAIDAKGVVYLTCTEAGAGLLLGKSLDGGTTWQDAQAVPTGGTAAKDALGAFGDGELYLCFQQGNLQVLHSTDHGATWTQSGFDTNAGCNGVAQGPDGAVYVVWQGAGAIEADNLNPAPPAFGVLSTLDHGRSWSSVTLNSDLGTAPQNLPGAPQAAAPSLAVSNVTGTVFVAAQHYQNAEVAGGVATQSTASAILARSRDHARTFTALRLPTVPSEACATCNQVHPTLAVDDRGRLVLQVTLSSADSLHKEVWMSVSGDEGDTWLPPVLLGLTDTNQSYAGAGNFLPDPASVAQAAGDVAKDPGSAPGAAQAQATHETWAVFHRDGGEYFGIATTPGVAVDLWVQHDANGKNAILARLVSILSTPA